jgi:hypothetical protein
VTQENETTVNVDIIYGTARQLVQRITSGNGYVGDGDVRAVKLEKNPLRRDAPGGEYLVTIQIRGSNYGAMMGIIVYRLIWWEFLIIPDDRFSLVDVDGDGFLEIRGERLQKKTFAFVRGILKDKAKLDNLRK